MMLKIIGQCDVKPIIMLSIKTGWKNLTYIITSIAAPPNRLAGILAIMSVSKLLLCYIHVVYVNDVTFPYYVDHKGISTFMYPVQVVAL